MKIAVSTLGRGMEDPVDPRFGRARGFVIVDSNQDNFAFVDNQSNIELAQGAGIQTAQFIADQEVTIVVSGRFGPKAAQVLNQAGIRMVTVPDGTTVREAVRQAGQTG